MIKTNCLWINNTKCIVVLEDNFLRGVMSSRCVAGSPEKGGACVHLCVCACVCVGMCTCVYVCVFAYCTYESGFICVYALCAYLS